MNLGDSGTQLSMGKDTFSGPGSDEALNSMGGLYTNREVVSRERIRTHCFSTQKDPNAENECSLNRQRDVLLTKQEGKFSYASCHILFTRMKFLKTNSTLPTESQQQVVLSTHLFSVQFAALFFAPFSQELNILGNSTTKK